MSDFSGPWAIPKLQPGDAVLIVRGPAGLVYWKPQLEGFIGRTGVICGSATRAEGALMDCWPVDVDGWNTHWFVAVVLQKIPPRPPAPQRQCKVEWEHCPWRPGVLVDELGPYSARLSTLLTPTVITK